MPWPLVWLENQLLVQTYEPLRWYFKVLGDLFSYLKIASDLQNIFEITNCMDLILIHKQLERHKCIYSTVATDALVLKAPGNQ